MKVHVFIFIYLALVFCACNNDDKIDEYNEEEIKKITNERDSLVADAIFQSLCNIDTLENGTIEYELKEGEAIEPSCPSEMSIGVDSTSAAREYYLNRLPIGYDEEVVNIGNDLYFDLGEYGYYRLNFVGTSTIYYRLELRLYNLQASICLNFIPSTLWPYNVSSPYNKGNVLLDANNKIWLCVKSAVNGQAGILMSWDYPVPTKTIKYYFKKIKRRSYTIDSREYNLYCNASTKEEWNCLADMYFNHQDEFKELYKSVADNPKCTEAFKNIGTSAPAQLYYGEFSKKHLAEGQSYRDAIYGFGSELGTGFLTYYITLEKTESGENFKNGILTTQTPNTDVLHNTISKSFKEKLSGFVVIYPANSK